jgi:hypothetical protein
MSNEKSRGIRLPAQSKDGPPGVCRRARLEAYLFTLSGHQVGKNLTVPTCYRQKGGSKLLIGLSEGSEFHAGDRVREGVRSLEVVLIEVH